MNFPIQPGTRMHFDVRTSKITFLHRGILSSLKDGKEFTHLPIIFNDYDEYWFKRFNDLIGFLEDMTGLEAGILGDKTEELVVEFREPKDSCDD